MPKGPYYLEQGALALEALNRYLDSDGRWKDKLLPDGGFVDEPVPASSSYHIMAAFEELSITRDRIGLAGDRTSG